MKCLGQMASDNIEEYSERFRPGGYFHMYAYWVCAARETPISALNFRSGAYNFYKLAKNPFRSITILLFLADFAVRETIIFKISRRSGDSHFHAQNGSSSFRSPAFSSSKRLKLVPEPHIFTLDREPVLEPLPIFHFAAAHTYQNLGWVPPPPPGGF